jgi:hypothetical protein
MSFQVPAVLVVSPPLILVVVSQATQQCRALELRHAGHAD